MLWRNIFVKIIPRMEIKKYIVFIPIRATSSNLVSFYQMPMIATFTLSFVATLLKASTKNKKFCFFHN